MKVIETVYNGYKFRSRLEARWAVFFDALGVKYEYEPEGFELDDGAKYLPDFKICVRHRSYTDEYEPVYVEVKGELSKNDRHKILCFEYPIILLGNIAKDYWEYIDQFFEYDLFNSYSLLDGDEYPALFSIYNGEPWICGADHDQWDFGKAMNSALLKARQARFEHGETP